MSEPEPEEELEEEEGDEKTKSKTPNKPKEGTLEYIHYWNNFEIDLPTPIDVSITGSVFYKCPPILWYNFDIFPHKMKVINTGFRLLMVARWKTERPYLIGGPFLPGTKYIFSQLHFHWGANMMEGSDHTVDGVPHPIEMHFVYFNSIYLTQEEGFKHKDGIVIICYLVRYGAIPDERLDFFVDAFPKIREAQTSTYIGPRPLSGFLNMFTEDYFVYWGSLDPLVDEDVTTPRMAMWIVTRIPMSASCEQIQEFRKLWDPWDEPNTHCYRPLQEREDRHVFLVNPQSSLYASLLPAPRAAPLSISAPSPAYTEHPEYFPEANQTLKEMYEKKETEDDVSQKTEEYNRYEIRSIDR